MANGKATGKFSELRGRMSPKAQAEGRQRVAKALHKMLMAELRRERELSQTQVADALGVSQTAVSTLESRSDMLLSTLNKYIIAMGGELKIIARFDDASVELAFDK